MAKKSKAGKKSAGRKRAGGRGPRLSLVMIAKDEEAHLPRALESARQWVDEIVLVDTGSSDRTVAIAESFGARVYHHPWENDFSKHRNQALGYAQGPWCLQLDADEAIDPATAPLLKQLINRQDVMAFQVEIINVITDVMRTSFYWPRLFRKAPGVGYTRKVHNQLVVPGRTEISQVRLYHYGYRQDEATMEARHQRRLEMIRAWVADSPEDWEGYYYLAQTLVTRPETRAEAVEVASKGLGLFREVPGRLTVSSIYLPLLQGLNELGRWEELIGHAGDWHRRAPAIPDPVLFLGRGLAALSRWDQVAEVAPLFWRLHQELRAHPELAGPYEINSLGLRHAFFVTHAQALERLGRRAEAVTLFLDHLCPEGDPALPAAAAKAAWGEGLRGLCRDLGRAVQEAHPDWAWARQLAALPAQEAPASPVAPPAPSPAPTPAAPRREDLVARAQAAGQAGKWEEALTIYQQALAAGPPDPALMAEAAFALATLGRNQEARKAYTAALGLDPDLLGALFNLAVLDLKEGDTEAARERLSRCLAAAPHFSAARELLERIR